MDVALRIGVVADPVRLAAAAVEFVSRILATDRRLRLTVETAHSPGELQFVFRPLKPRAGFHDRMAKVAVRAKTLVAQFDGAELLRADVVPQA